MCATVVMVDYQAWTGYSVAIPLHKCRVVLSDSSNFAIIANVVAKVFCGCHILGSGRDENSRISPNHAPNATGSH